MSHLHPKDASRIAYAMVAICLLWFGGVQAASPETGITGTVRLSPARPGVQREGETGTTPLPGARVRLRDASGTVIAVATTDADGQFQILAHEGRYEVRADVQGAAFPRCKAVAAEVLGGQMANVDINCDSGMR